MHKQILKMAIDYIGMRATGTIMDISKNLFDISRLKYFWAKFHLETKTRDIKQVLKILLQLYQKNENWNW